MVAHWSQFKWFRVLYIVFSRYMVVNTIIPIGGSTVQDEH